MRGHELYCVSILTECISPAWADTHSSVSPEPQESTHAPEPSADGFPRRKTQQMDGFCQGFAVEGHFLRGRLRRSAVLCWQKTLKCQNWGKQIVFLISAGAENVLTLKFILNFTNNNINIELSIQFWGRKPHNEMFWRMFKPLFSIKLRY